MWKQLTSLPYHVHFRMDTLKRTLPIWLLLVLALSIEGCKKK